MLVLARKHGERILVVVGGLEVWITLLDAPHARIGIEAPAGAAVVREEILSKPPRGKRRLEAVR